MAQLVDWDLAARVATRLRGAGPPVTLAEARAVVADLHRLAEDAAGHVAEFTGLRPATEQAPIRVVDRAGWANANVAGLREVIGPLLSELAGDRLPEGAAAGIASRITGVQAGTVLAYLSGRVLGQYEVFSADPGLLLLVAPNIVEVERKLGANPRDFRLWVCLHEVTHRTQFTAVPWLRRHFLDEVRAYVEASRAEGVPLVERLRQALSALADAARDPEGRTSVMDVVQTPAQRTVLERLVTLMTLLEGHAEYVMDGVGPEVIPSVASIRAAFDRRRQAGNAVEKLVRRLLGLDMKMRQYAEGRAFVRAVVDRVGMAGFNKVFESPEQLPRPEELADPAAWVSRVHPSVAA